jgi:uncharacterized protein (TIGR03435 family)
MKVRGPRLISRRWFIPLLALLLLATGVRGFAFPKFQTTKAAEVQSLPSATKEPSFAVASIRRNPKPTYMREQFTVDGFMAAGVTVRQLIQGAYMFSGYDRLTGEPPWVDTEYFDVTAKIDDSLAGTYADLSLEQRRSMLRLLLSDRFGLVIHKAKADRPIYNLVVAKDGSKLTASNPQEQTHSDIKGVHGLIARSGRGILGVEGFSMNDFANILEEQLIVDRPVVNYTGLTGYYDFSIHWTPGDLPVHGSAGVRDARQDGIPSDPGFSSTIFSEIQKQLGLKLQPSVGPVDILVVDHIEEPTAN